MPLVPKYKCPVPPEMLLAVPAGSWQLSQGSINLLQLLYLTHSCCLDISGTQGHLRCSWQPCPGNGFEPCATAVSGDRTRLRNRPRRHLFSQKPPTKRPYCSVHQWVHTKGGFFNSQQPVDIRFTYIIGTKINAEGRHTSTEKPSASGSDSCFLDT